MLQGRLMSGTLIAGAIVLGVVIMVAMAVAVAVPPEDHRRHEDSEGPMSAADFIRRDSTRQ